MEISWIGLLVCLALFLFGAALGDSLMVCLLASLALGATSVVTLNSLGGASPLVYVVPTGILIGSAFFRKGFTRNLGFIFHETYAAWLVFLLGFYAMFGAYVMPRLFRGGAVTLVAIRETGVMESPLAPVSGNISQTMYLVFGCLAYFAMALVLRDPPTRIDSIRRGYFSLAWLIAIFGLCDLFSKLAGLGDLLLPIRTANYALLTESEEAGFARLVGSFPEASAFAAASLPMLAFSYTHWQRTGSKWSMILSIFLFMLNLFSTSTTSLVGLFLLSLPISFSVLKAAPKGRIRFSDAKLVSVGFIVITLAIGVLLLFPSFFDPFVSAFDRIVLSKSQTASGQERGYWNAVAIQNVFDTYGLGVGMGSSRASSWVLAVLSQLGIPGILLFGLLTAYIWRGVPETGVRDPWLRDAVTLSYAARAAGLAAMAVGSISGSSADPGLCFFSAVAVTHAVRNVVGVTKGCESVQSEYPPYMSSSQGAMYYGRI